ECPDQRGITVRMCVEWVSESAWNPHRGLKIGAKVRIRSELEILTAVGDDLEDAEDIDAAEAESA
ncbi:hypothetical protein V2A09_31610, partial [Pseudomonas aeruginosa]